MDPTRPPSDAVTHALLAAGHQPRGELGRGMEGVVLDLGGGLVAKAWHSRPRAQLERLRDFYDALDAARPAVTTPRILEVLDAADQRVTVEERLEGRPLRAGMGDIAHHVTDEQVAALLEVLAALAAVPPDPALATLPALEDEPPLAVDVPFGPALADLVVRRARRSRASLLPRVPDLDDLVAAVVARLRDLPPGPTGLVHGDLIPANVLVGDDGAAPAVLDFGFLTVVGDPAFDAAVAASIHDMYGPRARVNEALLDDAVVARFGHDRSTLALYRAAYALVTATCFSASGSDGHAAWCVAVLGRPEVRAAL